MKIIFELSSQGTLDAPEETRTTEILERLGWLEDQKEKAKNSQKLGYILKGLGLKTKKKRDGAYLSFVEPKNDRKLKYLFKRYKIGDNQQET